MQIRFSEKTVYGIFQDTLNIPEDTSEDQISILKQERVNAWLQVMDVVNGE